MNRNGNTVKAVVGLLTASQAQPHHKHSRIQQKNRDADSVKFIKKPQFTFAASVRVWIECGNWYNGCSRQLH